MGSELGLDKLITQELPLQMVTGNWPYKLLHIAVKSQTGNIQGQGREEGYEGN